MRAALRIVRTEETAAPVVRWYRWRGVVLTGKVVWWVVTYLFWLAVAVVVAALVIIGAVLSAMGIMTHVAGDDR